MIGNPMVRKAVQVEYAVLRAPLTMLEQQVVSRYFDESSVVRASFERGLDVFDSAAARLLQQAPEPPEPPRPAPTASTPPRRRPATPPAPADVEPLPEEEQEEVAELVGELLEQEETETFKGELADDEMRRVQAELRAKHTVEEQAEHSGDTAP